MLIVCLRNLVCLCLPLFIFPPSLKAGWLFEAAGKWTNFSFQPEQHENSQNYYGLAPGLTLGYSIRDIFDVGIDGFYVPASRESSQAFGKDATLAFYGGTLALRIAKAIYLAGRGGGCQYHLLKPGTDPNELTGNWTGVCFGGSLGGIFRVGKSKTSSWQVAIDGMYGEMTHNGFPDDPKRKLDAFSFSIAYVFQSYHNFALENSIFNDFLNSLTFGW